MAEVNPVFYFETGAELFSGWLSQ